MVKNYLKLIVAVVFATNVMAQNIPTNVPTNGLVGWWPFNGNANDESGNGNNGMSFECLDTTDRFGNKKSALYFDGKNELNPLDATLNGQSQFNDQLQFEMTDSFRLKQKAFYDKFETELSKVDEAKLTSEEKIAISIGIVTLFVATAIIVSSVLIWKNTKSKKLGKPSETSPLLQ